MSIRTFTQLWPVLGTSEISHFIDVTGRVTERGKRQRSKRNLTFFDLVPKWLQQSGTPGRAASCCFPRHVSPELAGKGSSWELGPTLPCEWLLGPNRCCLPGCVLARSWAREHPHRMWASQVAVCCCTLPAPTPCSQSWYRALACRLREPQSSRFLGFPAAPSATVVEIPHLVSS